MTHRYQNLDALRALAVVSVLLYHYTARFPDTYTGLTDLPFHLAFGWLGVEIFFVVSGYCIAMTLGRVSTVTEFWAKRFARLQPAYMAGVLLTFGCVSLIGLPGRETSPFSAVANLFWLNALPPLKIPDVDGVYWSLVVELKFYFWIGLFFVGFGKRNLAMTWGIFTFAAFLARRKNAALADYLLIASYSPMFLFGMVAFSWKHQPRWLSLALVMEATVLTFGAPRFEGIRALACTVGAGTMVLTMLTAVRVPKPITWLGAVSYPLYLVHQNIGLLAIREALPLSPVLRIPIACLSSLGLAALIHYSVEFRFQKSVARLVEHALVRLTSIPGLWSGRVRAQL